jgi:hypothetical protein
MLGILTSIASRTHRMTACERALERYRLWLMLHLDERHMPAGAPEWLGDEVLRNS